MSGHSKWASIKHKKAAIDSKKGKVFNKLIREITVAARMSGGNPEDNPRLRLVMLKAKQANMPAENVEKAVKKGTGELEGVIYQEQRFEGYGPHGTAIIIDVLTDNKNRTTAEVRSIFSKNGGNLGENGCVSWMFSKKGLLTVKKETIKEEELFNMVVEAGAEDLQLADEMGVYEITSEPENFEAVKKILADKKIPVVSSEITTLPKTLVRVEDVNKAKAVVRLIDSLEDQDDVQNVYTNADIPTSVLEEE